VKYLLILIVILSEIKNRMAVSRTDIATTPPRNDIFR